MAAKIRSLQLWCKRQCEGYRDVEVTNMTSSWKSGLAFCAIIHRYRPDLIDYDSLSKENVYENNKLAFDVAQESLNIPALLDPEDMVAMAVPDKLCIVTYVSQYYNYFHDKNPEGGPGVKACRAPTKRSSTAQSAAPEPKKITPTKTSSATNKTTGQTPMAVTRSDNETRRDVSSKRGTYGDTCHLCRKKVYLMERHIEGSRLYHRRCIRDQQKSQRSPPVSSPGAQPQRSQPGGQRSAFQYPGTGTHSTTHGTTQGTRPAPLVNSLVSAKTSSSPAVSSSLQNSAQNSHKSVTSHQWSGSKVANGINSSNNVKDANKNSQPSAGGSSLVKLLYGGPAPYGSSSASESTAKQSSHSNPAKSPANSSPKPGSSPVTQHKSSVFTSKASSSISKPSSVSQRAAIFDTTPKPKFGAAFNPQSQSPAKSSVNHVAQTDSRTHGLSSNAQSLFPSDVPKHSRQPQPMELDTPFPTSHSMHVPAAKPTAYTYHTGVSETKSDNDIKTGLFASLANIRQTKSADVQKTTSYLSQTTVSTTTTRATSGAPGSTTTSILKTRATADNATDTSGHRSILKPASPRQSIDASVHSDHRPILKTRLSDEGDQLATSPPRSILKHGDNPPTDSEVRSGAITVTQPAKSILKPNEPVEFQIELDDRGIHSAGSQPRSILKHGDDVSPKHDDKGTSRSILKHDNGHLEGTQASKSIFKTPDHSKPDTQSKTSSDNTKPAATDRPKSGSVVPAPRAQVKVTAGGPAAKDTNMERRNSPVDFLAKSNRTPSPRSILRKSDHTSATKGPGRPTGARPWEKPVPKSDFSGAGPAVSSSLSKKSSQPPVTNNFSAFNLQDSLLLHEAKDEKPKSSKSASGVSIDKGKAGTTKPAWQIEMEARTGQAKNKRTAPPRPSAPPQGSANIHELTNTQKPAPKESQSGKTEWQLEAERRTNMRKGKYQDPEFKYKYTNKQDEPATSNGATKNVLPKRNSAEIPSSNLKVNIPEKPSRRSVGSILDSEKVTKSQPKVVSDSSVSSNPPRPPPRHKATSPETSRFSSPPHNYEMIWEPPHPADVGGSPASPGSKLARTPAFRINDSPESSPEISRSGEETSRSHFYVEVNGNDVTKKKILPEVDFTFKSGDFEVNPDSPGLSSWTSPGQESSWIQQRPLPTPPGIVDESGAIRREVKAEARMSTLKIVRELEDVDKQLRALEAEGRTMEDKIRAVSDDQMDDEESMTAWFETVSKRNELVRKEAELMYKQRQQELEDMHTDLEHELRILMAKPDHEKTASDRVRETSLIAELVETVDLRNNIVDSMEEDRIRYIQEDREIEQMMAKTVTTNGSDRKKKKKKGDKRKKDGKDEKAPEPSDKQKQEKERKFFRKSVGSGGL